jgi:organic radical activating enzyme
MQPLHLPWTPTTVPHCILDIIRECNVSCTACYNDKQITWRKTVAEVQTDLEFALAHRKLHTVTIAGGEPTLHPDLPEIIAMISRYGLRTVLLSNGLLINRTTAAAYKKSGLYAVVLHIDEGQTRVDLPAAPTTEDVIRLRDEKIAILAGQGLDVGLVMTVYQDTLHAVERVVRFILESADVNFLLATCHWDSPQFSNVTGSLEQGFQMQNSEDNSYASKNVLLTEMYSLMEGMDMRPFAYVGSSKNREDKRWLSYTSAVVQENEKNNRKKVHHCSMRSSLSDRFFISLIYYIKGRFIYYVKPNTARFIFQLFWNSLTGGRVVQNWKIFLQAVCFRKKIIEKRFVFQYGPTVSREGEVIHCENCPDATVVNNRFVPLCISDCMKKGQ